MDTYWGRVGLSAFSLVLMGLGAGCSPKILGLTGGACSIDVSKAETFGFHRETGYSHMISASIVVPGQGMRYLVDRYDSNTWDNWITSHSSLDGLATWTVATPEQISAQSTGYQRIALHPDGTYYMVFSHVEGGGRHWRMRKSTDFGATWSSLATGDYDADTGDTSQSSDILVTSEGTIIVAGQESDGSAGGWYGNLDYDLLIRRSTDGGVTWNDTVISSADPNTALLSGYLLQNPVTSDLVLLAFAKSTANQRTILVYRSTDDGATWSASHVWSEAAAAPGEVLWWMGATAASDGTLYATAYYYDGSLTTARVYRSEDSGSNWTDITMDAFAPGEYMSPGVDSIYSASDGTLYAVFDAADAGGNYWLPLYQSKDRGDTWTLVEQYAKDSEPEGLQALDVTQDEDGNLYVGIAGYDVAYDVSFMVRRYPCE